MTLTTFLFACAAYFVFTLSWAMLWNVVFLKKTYQAIVGPTLRDDPVIPLGMVAIAAQAVALALLFSLFYRGVEPLWEGVRLGLLTGVFTTCYGALVVPAKFRVEKAPAYVALEIVYGAVHAVGVGLLLAWVFGWHSP